MTPDLPWHACRLHVVGDSDVIRPDIPLQLEQPQHPAQHGARVDANAHVYIY